MVSPYCYKLASPHPSLPVNPLLADPLYLNKYIEKAGSGTLDIFDLCRRAKLDKPEFKMESGCFVVTLWRKNVKKDKTEQVTEQVTRLLVVVKSKALGTRAIMDALEISHRPTFLYTYLQPALNQGLIEMTQPDSPKSPTQKYRITNKGKQVLK